MHREFRPEPPSSSIALARLEAHLEARTRETLAALLEGRQSAEDAAEFLCWLSQRHALERERVRGRLR